MAFRPRSISGKTRHANMHWRTTIKFGDEVKAFWKKAKFIDDEGNERGFVSYSDFQEFVMKILIGRGEEGWKMLANQKLKPVFM